MAQPNQLKFNDLAPDMKMLGANGGLIKLPSLWVSAMLWASTGRSRLISIWSCKVSIHL